MNVEQKELLSKLPYIEYALFETEAFLKMIEHVAEEGNAMNDETVSSKSKQPVGENGVVFVDIPELPPSPASAELPIKEDPPRISKINAGCQAGPVMKNRYTWKEKKKKRDIGTDTVQIEAAGGSKPRDIVRMAFLKLLRMLQVVVRGGFSSLMSSSPATTNLCEVLLGRSFSLAPETMLLSNSQSMESLEKGVVAAMGYTFGDGLEAVGIEKAVDKLCGEQQQVVKQEKHEVESSVDMKNISPDGADQVQQIRENGGVTKMGETQRLLPQKQIDHTSPAIAEALLKSVLSGSGAGHVLGGELAIGKVENFAPPSISANVISGDSAPPLLTLVPEDTPPAASSSSLCALPNDDLFQPPVMARWHEDMDLYHNVQSGSPDELMSTLSQCHQSNIQDPSPPGREQCQAEKLSQTQSLPPPPDLESVSHVGEIWDSSTNPQHPPDWFDLLYINPPKPPQHWTKEMSGLSLEEHVPKYNKLEEEECAPVSAVLSSSQKHNGRRYGGNKNRKKRNPMAVDDHGGGCGDVQQFQQPHMVQKDWKQQQSGKVSSTVPQVLMNSNTLSSGGYRKNDTAGTSVDSHQGSHTTAATLNGSDYSDNNFAAVSRRKPSNHHVQESRRKPKHAVSVGSGKGRKQLKTTLIAPPPVSSNSGFVGSGSTGMGEAQRRTVRGKPYKKAGESPPCWTSSRVV